MKADSVFTSHLKNKPAWASEEYENKGPQWNLYFSRRISLHFTILTM